ncbi:DUF4783 domain-containing protein [Pedobacter namyangjuensis]|uniref:DUF4783 domain-containing protein n=1 Tax=Pedobacter namyangjuensis TaxID=600626 RepID=UPI001F063AD7|nr:DUF4783 domain-containing protein [Pedobacter namyangjuensis]
MMKPLLALLLLLLHLPSRNAPQVEIVDDLATYFRIGNAKEIAKHFAPSVELIIIDQEDVYNKAQSEQIIKDFFLKYPPSKSAIIHKLSNNPNYRLGILSLTTKNGKFRVTITMNVKKPANNFLITELRIEPDKE